MNALNESASLTTIVLLSGFAAAGCGSSSRSHHVPPQSTSPPTTSQPSSPPPSSPPTSSPPPSSPQPSSPPPSSPSQPPAGTPSDSATAEWLLEASLAPTTASEVVLQAALAQIQPETFAPPIGPSLTATGTPLSGAVVVDFGSGSIFNKLTFTGAVGGTWTATGAERWELTLTFTQFGTDSLIGGSSLLDGSLSYAVQITGSTVTAVLSGSVTKTSSSFFSGTSVTTVSPNLSYAVDTATGLSVIDGTLDLSTGTLGTWSVTSRALTFGSGSVRSGELQLERRSFPQVSVTFTFTSPAGGTFLVDPLGIPGTFSL
ncbi:MAG TPA: hypothetical protein DEA08_23650 [Planctomycetes bacterium]|nr:hypothetical protein [Planctomycetota bacterium]